MALGLENDPEKGREEKAGGRLSAPIRKYEDRRRWRFACAGDGRSQAVNGKAPEGRPGWSRSRLVGEGVQDQGERE